jgi:hypothetical protein
MRSKEMDFKRKRRGELQKKSNFVFLISIAKPMKRCLKRSILQKVLGCSKNKKIFSKFLFIAYDVWEQSEKSGGE